jgi:hypothetical protein
LEKKRILPKKKFAIIQLLFLGLDFLVNNSRGKSQAKELLISRYGDIPRFIFTADDDLLEMIEYVKQNAAVRDKHYSHRLLKIDFYRY